MESFAPIFAVVLLLARMVPILELTLPGELVPRTVRWAAALGLVGLLAPTALPPDLLVASPSLVEGVLLLVREVGVGLVIGFLGGLVFEGARMAGGIIDRSGSFARGERDGPVARLYTLLAVALFFLLGGPRLWLYAVGQSYALFSLDAPVSVESGLALARAVADVIAFAVLLALPVLAVLLLTEFLIALAARVSSVVRVGLPPASTRTLVVVAAVALCAGGGAEELGATVVDAMAALPAAMEGLNVR